jgi:thioesterase domain-containing protein
MTRIRVLQPTGTRKPLYLFTGIGGTLDTFVDLARQLSDERPVYGMKMVGSQGECEPLREMQQLASTHAADIREVQAHGPYFLFGYSFGGVLAFETARELQSQGERVGLVAMADCPAPGYPKLPPAHRRVRTHVQNFFKNSGRLAYLQARITNRVKVTQRMLGVREAVEDVAETVEDPVERRVCNALHEAYTHYTPVPLSVDVLFLSADSKPGWPAQEFDDPMLGWGPAMRGRIIQCQTPGTHLTMFEPGNVDALVQHLRAGLAQAERALSSRPSMEPPAFS